MFEVRQTAEFSRWLAALLDPVGRATVLTWLARLRAYYMRVGESVYLMLGGGDKSSQAKDVDRAIRMASGLKSAARAKKARKSK